MPYDHDTPSPLRTHEDVLAAIAEAIDIPDYMLERATARYQSLGQHLDRPESRISGFQPHVSPQGSMLLGTVVRPIGDDDQYDFDLVCTLKAASKADFTQAGLKEAVGDEILGYARKNNMSKTPVDGRRCWTLEYSEGESFHMDVLPAIPDADTYRDVMLRKGYSHIANDAQITQHAIAITDKQHENYEVHCYDWLVSNPKGYAAWFKSRQAVQVAIRKGQLVERGAYARVDDVPDHKVKTPLQRAIQLLKRHRDTMFEGRDDKPISIIITTLAARAYNGEDTITNALRTILGTMHLQFDEEDGRRIVRNPVNPSENFADKWPAHPEKEAAFDEWLDKARQDFGIFLHRALTDLPVTFEKAMTSRTIAKVRDRVLLAAPAVTSLADEARARAADGSGYQPWAICR